MPLAVDDIVLKVAREGAFDTTTEDASSTAILAWVNAALSEAIGEAKWVKSTLQLAVTAAGTSEYAVPDTVVDLDQLWVGDGRAYVRCGLNDLRDLDAGRSSLRDADGAYAQTGDAVKLWPVPDAAGVAIVATCAVLPDELEAGDPASAVRLPRDMVEPVCVDGAIAIGYLRVKADPEGGAAFQARFEGAKGKLKARTNSRIGGGPIQIRLSR